MNAEQWERTKSLFDVARKRDDFEAFVAHACPDDFDVRGEVLRLLRESSQLEADFLEPPEKHTLLDRAVRSLAVRSAEGYEGDILSGRYAIEREIGRGGSGVVYLAHDRQLHSRPVALKFLHAGWEDDEHLKARFAREIEALSRIRHPGVVGVLDVGHAADGRSFLVMEYVEGSTLRSILKKGPVEYPRAREIVDMICDALGAAHQQGVLHRDLKPENIMLASAADCRTVARLIDFGIAKVRYDEMATRTDSVTIIGTVHYVAPEQLMGRPGPRSDIFALGVVCYEMLTGHKPFEPETPFQLYEMQRAGKVAAPSRLQRRIPRHADDAILRALSFRPEHRQGSVQQFAEEFRTPTHTHARLRKMVGAGIASGALLLAAAGWEWTHDPSARYDHVIETVGGRNPEEAGFERRLDLIERAVYNQERTGFDAIRLQSGNQGYYSHKLTRTQAHAALRNGWKISATLKAVKGLASVVIDLSPAGGRYDLNVVLDSSGQQVAFLNQRIADGLDGLRYEIEAPVDTYHDYQLIFDPATREARLLVDGVERLRGYRGHNEYVEGRGLLVGTGLYKSNSGEAFFKRVRFEIN